MPLYYVDFTPQLLQAELPFSTLSLTGSCGGPKYETFSVLVHRANDWLRRRSNISIVHVEVVEVGGVYTSSAVQVSKSKDSSVSSGIPAYLKIIRLWYLHESSPADGVACQLGYTHVIPARLESNPRAFNPKFQTLEASLNDLNQQLASGEKIIDGKLLSIQTSLFRFGSRNCSLDPERTFWMISDTSEVHICFYFTVFHIRSVTGNGSRSRPKNVHELHFRDFASKFVTTEDEKKSSRKSETISLLMDRVRQVIDELKLNVINIQTIDHHAYYRCAMDTPGFEEKTLSNPHYRSSLSGLLQCAKVLRVYFCACPVCLHPLRDASALRQIVHKTFHVTRNPFPCSQLDFSQSDLDLQARLETNVMSQMNDWIDSSGVTVVSVETVKLGVTDSQYRRISADDTHFRSMLSPTAGTFYAVRLYVLVPSESACEVDLKPVPRYIQSRYFSCVIL